MTKLETVPHGDAELLRLGDEHKTLCNRRGDRRETLRRAYGEHQPADRGGCLTVLFPSALISPVVTGVDTFRGVLAPQIFFALSSMLDETNAGGHRDAGGDPRGVSG